MDAHPIRGWIYLITNKAMPGLVKIGYSTKDAILRAKEIDSTGSPLPFVVEYDVLLENPYEYEQRLHKLFSERRVGKEWFRIGTQELIREVKKIIGNNALVENVYTEHQEHDLPIVRYWQDVPSRVLLLSTSDTCRGPMAAAYLRMLLRSRENKILDVSSAGVMAIRGLCASPDAMRLLEAEGIGLRHHSATPLTLELIQSADLILAMSPFHVQTALRLSDESKSKTVLLRRYAGLNSDSVSVTDPLGCGYDKHKEVFSEIKLACERLVAKWLQNRE